MSCRRCCISLQDMVRRAYNGKAQTYVLQALLYFLAVALILSFVSSS